MIPPVVLLFTSNILSPFVEFVMLNLSLPVLLKFNEFPTGPKSNDATVIAFVLVAPAFVTCCNVGIVPTLSLN